MESVSASSSGQVSGREWLWVVIFAALVMALTTIPYLIAGSRGDVDWVFGGFVYGVEDGHSYLGKMRLGARGQLDFHLFYTPESHDPAPLIFLSYLLPGWIVGRLIAPTDPALTPTLIVVFHGLRVVFGAGLIAVVYLFAARFLHETRPRRLATVLATFGGGFGWLLLLSGTPDLYGTPPPEFFIPEGFSWMILLGIPHLALARLALLGGLLTLLTAARRERWVGWSIGAAACWCVMGATVPFYLAIVYTVVGAWGIAAWIGERRFPVALFVRAMSACGLTLPLFAYYTLTFAGNPAFAVWSAQNVLASPAPILYLLAYALIGLLALLSARLVWRLGGAHRLLVAWVIVVPILVYLPINVQRRMSEAVIVPLAILAAFTLTRTRPLLRAPLVILMTASSAVLLFVALLSAARGGTPDSNLFRRADDVAAFAWLSANADLDTIILSAVPTGNALPAYSDLRTVMGHGPETLFWRDKTVQVERFYGGTMSAPERRALLDRPCAPDFQCDAVRYIYYGQSERALAGIADANAWIRDPGVGMVYDQEGVQIYRYAPP